MTAQKRSKIIRRAIKSAKNRLNGLKKLYYDPYI